MYFFFFKQKTAYEMLRSLVGSEMCIRDRGNGGALDFEMNDGKNVLVYGDVAVYRPQGRVQLLSLIHI